MNLDGFAVADVKEEFVDKWRSVLKGSLERLENAVLNKQISEDHKESVQETISLEKGALEKLRVLEISLSEFGEIVSKLEEIITE